jgi:DNA-directed RNA polymerase subunit M/transcription elongation factor TFIIS
MKQKKQLRTLFFDLETSPMLAWVWSCGKTRINPGQLKKGSRVDIICVCWKWAHESKVHSLDWGFHKQNSRALIEKFTRVVESADLVIAQNGDAFDIKHMNTQRLLHNLPPISWPTSEDTLKQLRKYFKFPSNSLDYVAKTLYGTGKLPMGLEYWTDVVDKRSPKALAHMIKYCKKDVRLLEQVFNKIKPYCKPKAALDSKACPRCNTNHVSYWGWYISLANRVRRCKCQECGHVFLSRQRYPNSAEDPIIEG